MRYSRALAGSAPVALLVLALFLSLNPSANASDTTPTTSASPSPSPTPTPTPSPTREPSPTPTPTPTPTSTPTVVPTPTPALVEEVEPDKPRKKKNDAGEIWWDFGPSYGGTYSTDELVELEALLASLGVEDDKLRELYAPFIVRGPAEFSDTWGSIRHGDGKELRPHLGQDVFCELDAEVLAVEDGVIEFGSDELGGNVAELHRPDGGYWYYAHLSDFPRELQSGDRVEEGDVIGYCGDSGNASGGSPHVHFGSYPGPVNPAGDLIGWLEQAAREAEELRARSIELRGDAAETARLFGDDLVPESDPIYPERPEPAVPSVIDILVPYDPEAAITG